MKTAGAPSAIDILAADARSEVAVGRDEGGARFEETFAHAASKQQTGHGRHHHVGPHDVDDGARAEKPRHPSGPHRGYLQRALARLNADDAGPSRDCDRSVAGTPADEQQNSITPIRQSVELASVVQSSPIVGSADKEAAPDGEHGAVDRSRLAPEGRHRRLALPDAKHDEHNKGGDADAAGLDQPVAKVIGEEVHFAPVRASGTRGDLERTAGGSEASTDDRQDHARRDRSERGAGIDTMAAAPAAGGVDRKPEIATKSDVSVEADTAARASPSTATIQVLDGLFKKGDWVGETAARPTSGASQTDDKPVFSPFVRSLKIQLAPQSLGIVNVVVVRGEDSLRIRLESDVSETRHALIADRDSIGRQLEASGLRVDEVVVMRSSDTSNGAMSDSRSATASGWADGSYSGQRSEHGQPRQSPRHVADDAADQAEADANSENSNRLQERAGGDRFLGRRMLRSI